MIIDGIQKGRSSFELTCAMVGHLCNVAEILRSGRREAGLLVVTDNGHTVIPITDMPMLVRTTDNGAYLCHVYGMIDVDFIREVVLIGDLP